jgi:hypothetical protein
VKPGPSLDLNTADLSALKRAASGLLARLEAYLELPSKPAWSHVAFAALKLEQEVLALAPNLAMLEWIAPVQAEGEEARPPVRTTAIAPLCHGPEEKFGPFYDLFVLLRACRPDPAGCGLTVAPELSPGCVWASGPDNLDDARGIAQRLRPVVRRLEGGHAPVSGQAGTTTGDEAPPSAAAEKRERSLPLEDAPRQTRRLLSYMLNRESAPVNAFVEHVWEASYDKVKDNAIHAAIHRANHFLSEQGHPRLLEKVRDEPVVRWV